MLEKWLLSIVGIVFLGIITDVVLTDGKLSGFLKVIYAFIFLLVFIMPFKNFDFNNISYSLFEYEEKELIDYNYLEFIKDKKFKQLADVINNELKAKYIRLDDIKFEGEYYNYELIIKKVTINLKKVVILENNENINIIKETVKAIHNSINIDEVNIIFYE